MAQVILDKLPISAIIVGFNEASIIEDCFKSVLFCEEILYVDLGSSDNSVACAQKYTSQVIRHERVNVVEIIHEKFCKQLRYDWILIIDPDERVSHELYLDIVKFFKNNIDPKIGGVFVPWAFFFKRHRLKGTPWGGDNLRLLIFHKARMKMTSSVHNGRTLLPSFEMYTIPDRGNNWNLHYWMSSYKQLLEKHRRYLQVEPKSRFDLGKKTNLIRIIKTPLIQFKYAFIDKKGYKDGFVGLFLSLFWSWYQTKSEYGLFKYTKKKNITEQ